MSIAGYMVANFPASKWPWRPTFEHVHVRSVVKKRALSARSRYADERDHPASWTCDKSHCCVYVFPQPPAAGIKGEHQTVARKLLTPQTIRLGHGDTQGVWSVEDMTSQLASWQEAHVCYPDTVSSICIYKCVTASPPRLVPGAMPMSHPLDRWAPPHLSWPPEQKNCARGPKFRWVQYMRNFQTFAAQPRPGLSESENTEAASMGPGPRLPRTPADNYIFILTSRRLVLKAEFRYWILDTFALFE